MLTTYISAIHYGDILQIQLPNVSYTWRITDSQDIFVCAGWAAGFNTGNGKKLSWGCLGAA